MAAFGEALTAVRRGFVRFVIGCVKCKPLSIFGVFLILAIIFNAVSPTSLLSFLFVIASYISGALLVIWVFSSLFTKSGD